MEDPMSDSFSTLSNNGSNESYTMHTIRSPVPIPSNDRIDREQSQYLCLANVHLVSPEYPQALSPLTQLWVDTKLGIIINPEDTPEPLRSPIPEVIDCEGNILSSGMIDIQINGGFGVDLSEIPDRGKGGKDKYQANVVRLAERLLKMGVTSFVPTVISQRADVYHQVLPLLQSSANLFLSKSSGDLIATPLGWHAEGPFITKAGCHPPENLRKEAGSVAVFEKMYGASLHDRGSGHIERSPVKIVTLAPDVEGVQPVIVHLASEDIIVSLGHTNASTPQALGAVFSGAKLITHLFNAMPGLHHRDPSIIGLLGLPKDANIARNCQMNVRSQAEKLHSALATPIKLLAPGLHSPITPDASTPPRRDSSNTSGRPLTPVKDGTEANMDMPGVESKAEVGSYAKGIKRPFYSIIADGIHVHPQAIAMAYNAHPDGCILVSDAMHMLDPSLPDGKYDWREGQQIEKKNGAVTLAGSDTLAGSILPLPQAVRNLSQFVGISLAQAILCATYHPAQVLGSWVAEHRSCLQVGSDADFVLWDKYTGQVLTVWKDGQRVDI